MTHPQSTPRRTRRRTHACLNCDTLIVATANYCRACMNQFRSGGYKRGAIPDRLAAKLTKTDDCWLWGGTISRYGYGMLSVPVGWPSKITSGKWHYQGVHRIAWVLASGAAIPDGMDVLHTCDVRNCARNDEPGIYVVNGREYPRFGHLFLGDSLANIQDMHAKGRYAFPVASGQRNGHYTHPERTARGDRNGSRLHPERLHRGEQWQQAHQGSILRGSAHGMAKLTDMQVAEIRRRYQEPNHPSQVVLAAEFGVTQTTISRIVTDKRWRPL